MRRQAIQEHRLLAERLAHAHPHGSLDLTGDGQRVDRMAAVQRDPNLVNGDGAAELIDADLDHLRGVAESHGRADRSATLLAALRLRRAGERALAGQRSLVDQRCFGDLRERQRFLIPAGQMERAAETLDRVLRGVELAGGRRDQHLLQVPARRRSPHCPP